MIIVTLFIVCLIALPIGWQLASSGRCVVGYEQKEANDFFVRANPIKRHFMAASASSNFNQNKLCFSVRVFHFHLHNSWRLNKLWQVLPRGFAYRFELPIG
jgi:hypothetical protein